MTPGEVLLRLMAEVRILPLHDFFRETDADGNEWPRFGWVVAVDDGVAQPDTYWYRAEDWQ